LPRKTASVERLFFVLYEQNLPALPSAKSEGKPDDIGLVCGENCPLYSASLVVLDEWLGKIMD
jgi:hypothetical protein